MSLQVIDFNSLNVASGVPRCDRTGGSVTADQACNSVNYLLSMAYSMRHVRHRYPVQPGNGMGGSYQEMILAVISIE